MGAWPDAVTARNELRGFVNDGSQDRPVKNKQVIGVVDGVNAVFLTFEDRIVPNTLAVTVEFVAVPFTVLDLVLGQFQTTQPPAQQTTVRATYYFQYFLDAELDEALRNASGELQESDDITLTPFGLKSAALNFGAYFCFKKQAVRWAARMSERFILEEVPVDGQAPQRSNLFDKMADSFLKNATAFRESFYTRHGRRNAPAMGVYMPRIPPIAPRR